ncbi:MAG: LysR family transcriptional regulator [Polaromonas sp.]|uniref:LysR family transcriptional regulator n=1 Tax=Polaromonas sp. TaxID=1869339 RepID=UPI0025F6A359|nr:LysR family transcriptional regulator [Polaromonas sp.]MBI2727148.1 LysR family transcriptional regulator [Polaromonas sp.]
MKSKDLDLNLLPVFEALMRNRSVAKTSIELEYSQPAMSNLLAKLRKSLGDQLFVRAGRGITPTPYAEQFAKSVLPALKMISAGMQGESAFDPRTSERSFNLLLTDSGEAIFLPRLIAYCQMNAPGIQIRASSIPSSGYANALEKGLADIAIGHLRELPESLVRQLLFSDSLTCLMRNGHPFAGKKLSAEQYRRAMHLVVRAPGTGNGIPRTVANYRGKIVPLAEVTHYWAVPAILVDSDLICTLSRRIASQMNAHGEFVLLDLPFKSPKFDVRQYWHPSAKNDKGHIWLRRTIYKLFSE